MNTVCMILAISPLWMKNNRHLLLLSIKLLVQILLVRFVLGVLDKYLNLTRLLLVGFEQKDDWESRGEKNDSEIRKIKNKWI